jgi:hypothetical protein
MRPENISGTRLRLDYFSDIRYLAIKHNESIVLTVDLKDYFCNRNDICEFPQETYISCPEDCSAYTRDGYCAGVSGDGKCDPDCGNKFDTDCPPDETTNATVITKTMADFNRTEYEAWYISQFRNQTCVDCGLCSGLDCLRPTGYFYLLVAGGVLLLGIGIWVILKGRKNRTT